MTKTPSTTGNTRGKSLSKMEHKLSLVARRLAMLQDSDSGGDCENKEENSSDPSSSGADQDDVKYGVDDPLEEEDDSFRLVKQQVGVASAPPANRISIPKKKKLKGKKDTRSHESYRAGKSKPLVMKQAGELQSKLLLHQCPTFIKYMLRSHVTCGFWLGLPKKFCDEYLPKCVSVIMNLIDENGKKYEAKYLGDKVGLSGGWRGFSVAHSIQEGDATVFQLIGPTIFKVYVIKADTCTDTVGGALEPLDLYSCGDHRVASVGRSGYKRCQRRKIAAAGDHLTKGKPSPQLLLVEERKSLEEENAEESMMQFGRENDPSPEIRSADSGVLDGIRLADSTMSISFHEVRNFDNFHIIVNGLIIDCKFNHHVRKKYYDLCCIQDSFLHETLLQGLNSTLIVGIINETVNIADAVRISQAASTSHDDLVTWDKTLQGFEVLGMKTAFLRARIQLLLGLVVVNKLEAADSLSERYKEANLRRARAGNSMTAG